MHLPQLCYGLEYIRWVTVCKTGENDQNFFSRIAGHLWALKFSQGHFQSILEAWLAFEVFEWFENFDVFVDGAVEFRHSYGPFSVSEDDAKLGKWVWLTKLENEIREELFDHMGPWGTQVL